ncbi:MAG: AAA family ATPase [Candidatus Cryptobacteroides sp.]
MFIDSIILNNFRAYKGINQTSFQRNGKNVFVIAGNNGFGKTTFLTSLVWCLYGKLMVDVDDKFRKDINDAQGYKNFAKANLNKECAQKIDNIDLSPDDKRIISKKGYIEQFENIKSDSQYSVEIHITDAFIPAVPCSEILIRRTFDYFLESETLEVLIDGQVNKLAKEVGYDIFINDFILSKNIATFFLFDAEKIVNLAEVKSLEEKRKLSSAYSEVLGIRKYEDIRRNLENLRIKFRKKAGSIISQNKLEKLTNEINIIEGNTSENEASAISIDNQITMLRAEKDSLQEKLIREGNAISIEELARFKDLVKTLKEKDSTLKAKFKDMMEIAPFVISGRLLCEVQKQADKEQVSKSKLVNSETLVTAMHTAQRAILAGAAGLLSEQQNRMLEAIIEQSFRNSITEYAPDNTIDDVKTLLDYTPSELNELNALVDNIRYSFSVSFKQLVKDIKNNSIFLQKTQRKISLAEYDDENTHIRDIRNRKAEVERTLFELENKSRSIAEKKGLLMRDYSIKKKQLSECVKLVKVDDMDKEKDIIAERLIRELTIFLTQLKEKRKFSLEAKIKQAIDILMHKNDFISDVSIDILEDVIEINLLDKDGNVIDKDKLSKGEQQLYATSILKALVDESGISFPVFIDSPLQKFDSIHSRNIISKFYPAVSEQVVIFPLLGKELSKIEYEYLLPNVNKSFIILNENGRSSFKEVEPNNIFDYVG